MRYTPHQHRHNFSVWAAARASQRGFATVASLRIALEQCGVEDFARKPKKLGSFDEQHRTWCRAICVTLDSMELKGATYGRAAKLINVYLKGMVVLADINSNAAAIVHPPVDRILLRNIAADTAIAKHHRAICRRVNWTQLDESQYFELISVLREIKGDDPFWKLERYWSVAG